MVIQTRWYFDQINAATLAEEFASNETFQYIKYLEAEREKLHSQMRDIANQLTSAKVSNELLIN